MSTTPYFECPKDCNSRFETPSGCSNSTKNQCKVHIDRIELAVELMELYEKAILADDSSDAKDEDTPEEINRENKLENTEVEDIDYFDNDSVDIG